MDILVRDEFGKIGMLVAVEKGRQCPFKIHCEDSGNFRYVKSVTAI